MTVRPWPKRLYGLDASRGIAAIAVVFWHWKHFAFVGSSLPAGFDHSLQPFYPALKLFYHLGWLGVEYFFVLSGFIFFWIYRRPIEDRRVGPATFAVRRAARLYPLHLATLVAVAVLQFVYRLRTTEFFVFPINDAYHFILNMGFAQSWGFERGWSFNAPVWSVSFEVLLYVAFFVVALLRRGGPITCIVISAVALTASVNGLGRGTGAVSLFFLGGAVFYLTRLITSRHSAWRIAVYSVCVGSWLLTFANAYVVKFALPLHNTMVGEFIQQQFPTHILFPSTVATLALLEVQRSQLGSRMAWLGDISYSSYLLHFPLQLLIGLAVAFDIVDGDFYQRPLSLVLFIAALVAASHTVFHRFERPLQKVIRRRFGSGQGVTRSVRSAPG